VTVGGQRRKRGGRTTPPGGAGRRGGTERLRTAERMGLEDIFAKLLRSARRDLGGGIDPVGVEVWASQLWSVWEGQYLVDMDPAAVFAGGLIEYAAGRRTPEALMVLLALAAVAPEPYGAKARRTATRLMESGVVRPSWTETVGAATPTSAWLTFDPVDDDGISVMVGFDGPAGAHTLGVYIDHNLGGIAKDGFAVPATINEVLERLRESDETEPVEYCEVSVEEAAERWRGAFEMTDMTLDPPVTEDLGHLRALLLSRLSKMPTAGQAPADGEIGDTERERLLDEFLESDETIGLWGIDGDEGRHVEHLALQAMTFSLDYVRGTPLRFSPVMVEIFCLHWAPRKIAADEDAFTLLPDVLAAWIRFVGRRRGIPEVSIGEAVEAAYGYAPEMIELSQDPANWGPAKTIALAVHERGIDITDKSALDDFIAEVNDNGGIDLLAQSLASPPALSR
jgi:hypothetical protein